MNFLPAERIRKLLTLVLALMLLIASVAPVRAEGIFDAIKNKFADKPLYPIINAPGSQNWGKPAWLDNDRLIIYISGNPDSDNGATTNRKAGTYIWNVKTGLLELLSTKWRLNCFNGEFAEWGYSTSLKEPVHRKFGKFGQEIELPLKYLEKGEIHSDFSCKIYREDELTPPVPRYHRVVVLKEGDGYLYLDSQDLAEQRSFPRNLVLYQAKTGTEVPLPITREEEVDVSYSAFRGAYVLKPASPRGTPLGIRGAWPKDMPLVVYLLWADGRVELYVSTVLAERISVCSSANESRLAFRWRQLLQIVGSLPVRW